MPLATVRLAFFSFLFTGALAAQSALPLLLGQLGSPDWQKRAEAFERIVKEPGALENTQVRASLLSTLDKENMFWRSVLRLGPNSKVPVGEAESFGEYCSTLLGVVEGYADYSSPETLRIFVQAGFNADSKFAEKLARHVDGFIPVLIEDAGSEVSVVRLQAIDYIGLILHKFRPAALKGEGAAQLIQCLRKRADFDEDEGLRRIASKALRNLADVNGDGKVDCADLGIVEAALDKKAGDPGFDSRADIAFRRVVGKEDAAYVSQFLPLGARCRQ